MAPQHDFILDNQNGAQFRADLNLALEAIATVSSGAVEPTTTYAYQYWADTTTNYLKQRDASNAGWIVRGKLTEDYGQAGQVLTSAGSGLPAVWADNTDANAWTVAQDATNAHFTFTGNGFDGTEVNPDIYLVRGGVYNFTNASTTKGFQIQSTAGLSGTAYSDGITNNPALAPDASTTETLVWTVQMDAPSELYYHSTVDAGPGGNIYILDESTGGALEWTLTANGTSDYIFAGPGFAGTETDPDLYVVRGQTYKFTNSMGAHPFQIQSTQGTSGTAYNDGITNNGVSNGTLTWEVRMDAPSTLYYQCTSHADMNGTIYVLDESGSGAVSSVNTQTGAVSLGIEDLDDFRLQANPPVASSYNAAKQADGDFTGAGSTTGGFALDGASNGYNGIYINKNAPTSGTSLASQGFTAGTSLDLWVSADGVNFTQHTANQSFNQGANNAQFHQLSPNLSAYSSANALYFSLTSAAGTPIALAEGDVIQYESASSKFRPVQLGVDGLIDVDTSTTAPVDGNVLAWDNSASKWEPSDLRPLLGIGEYLDDAAAGAGGVPSGSLYYNITFSDYRLKL